MVALADGLHEIRAALSSAGELGFDAPQAMTAGEKAWVRVKDDWAMG